MNPLFLTIFGVIFVVVLGALFAGFGFLSAKSRTAFTRFLRTEKPPDSGPEPVMKVFIEESELGRQKSLLADLPVFRQLQQKIAAAGMNWPVEGLLSSMLIGAALGTFIGYILPFLAVRPFTMVVLGITGALVPWLVLAYRARMRRNAFEEQLPEALDFITRAVRAGHAFSVSVEMLAADGPEPIRSEFRQVFNEINLGAPLEVALKGMIQRVPTVDVRFFVSAVLLQREAGGNLSEIMMKLAHTIRERMRVRGQVVAVTAHARMTAVILTAIPIVVAVVMTVQAPSYMSFFVKDSFGRWLGAGAIVAQVLGYIVMKRMIDIKV